MLLRKYFAAVRLLAASVLVVGAAEVPIERAVAHENHAPLPTKGVTVAGDTIMLSDKAREAIRLTTEKIDFGDIHRTVTVNARVELPWYAQAMITSLVPGKIDVVLVRPGETVVPGQEACASCQYRVGDSATRLVAGQGAARTCAQARRSTHGARSARYYCRQSAAGITSPAGGSVSRASDYPAEAPRARPG